ncbi:SDR family NAD(P)-dependent oxidoreductase [Pseudoruegeria sp. SHC-113]|uniref:SDR family NAD(P)-dependent oxidoreductase n=1 Tax=Pseudoruegeria sp. SHC-113 TaxID=2855439 RepID=UPI0021BAB9F8|nr:SDR family oxidoreductase [Pseudoruegeria sp. SHC-113]MCT8161712.1 SDR family oxidoreductase [Pseudoruegeria sp. SHC-113]
MSGRLTGKRVIVTGAGAGIGLGILRACVAEGAQVTGFEIRAEARVAVEAAGGSFRQVDVADAAKLQAAIAEVAQAAGGLDGLVNNAGITIQKPLQEMTLQEMDLLWQVNQRSCLLAAQSAAPLMAAGGGGSIVNIASNHARASDLGYEAYAGTKGAIVAMTRAMAWSLGRDGIRVNALAPGLTMTEAVAGVAEREGRQQEFNSWHATGQVASTEEIGRLAAFLLSPDSAALTGAEIIADHGMSARLGAI